MWFIGVEVEQETSAAPPKKNPGSAPGFFNLCVIREEALLDDSKKGGCEADQLDNLRCLDTQ